MAATSYNPQHSPTAVVIHPRIAVEWICDLDHEHVIECLWVWHDCDQVLGAESIAPGSTFGWRPAGVGAHDLISVEPLHIEASVYWPECCGMHGWIRDGQWVDA